MKSFAAVCFGIVLLPFTTGAQQAGPPVGNFTAPANGDHQIHIDVVVTGKNGRQPVLGLEKHDFSILDNKQEQPILSFQASGSAASPSDQPHVVIVADGVNATFEGVSYEQQQLDKFFRANGGKLAFPTSLITVTDSGIQVQNASNGNALATAMDNTARALRVINRSQGFWGAADRLNLSLNSLQRIVAFEARQPGRKLVIWTGPGWPILSGPGVQLTYKQEQNIYQSIASTFNTMRTARITLYNTMPFAMGNLNRLLYYEAFLKPVSKFSQAVYGNLSLQVLAVQSGGLVLNSSTDLVPQIKSCLMDADTSYSLSFASQPSDKRDTFHAIDVRVDRPNVKVRTWSGYYAEP